MAKYFDQLKEKSQIDNFFELAKKASGVPNSVAAPAIQGSPAAAGVRGTVQPAAATQPGRVAPAAAAAPQGRVQR
jgi:hypothetical protein